MKISASLLQNAAVYSASNILNATIPFLLLPILTRVLSPTDYGVLAMFTSSLGILGAVTGLGVQGAINTRYFERETIDFPRYVGSCFAILLCSSFAALLVVILFQAPLSRFVAIPSFWLMMAVATSGCTALVQMRLGIWLMGKKPVAYGTFQVSQSLVNIGISLFLVLGLHEGYSGRLWGQVLAAGVFACAGLVSLYSGGWIDFRPRLDYVREGLAFGLPLVPHVVGGFLVSLADRFIINKQLGLTAAGIYMVAAQIGMGMMLLSDSFNKAFVPWLYERLYAGDSDSKRRIVKWTWVYFGVALLVACIVALLSRWILHLAAGAKYLEAYKPLIWLAFGQAFTGMYLMVTNYVFYCRKTTFFSITTLFGGCLGLALTWFLVPVLGIAGAGVSFAIAMFARFLMTWYLANRVYPMPWFSFWKGVGQ